MTQRRLGWLLLLAGLLAGLAALGSRWADRAAARTADRDAAAVARTHLGLLTSELQKFRLLPLVLAEYPDVAEALAHVPAATMRLDAMLEVLAARTDAAAVYAIDAKGRAVAASNWRRPTSFVGQDYTFRRYFSQAMTQGGAELFALGSVSGRPGLYLARRIDRDGRPLGVIVVKVEFDRVEREWAQTQGATIVTDPRGLIMVTSVPGWRFRPVQPLDAATIAALRRSRQFGATPPTLPAFTREGRRALVGKARFRIASIAAPMAGGRLLHLAPLAPPLVAARTQALLWGSGLLLLLGVALRNMERRRAQARARTALEREVAHRTAELRDSNAQLMVESEERAAAERRFRAAREELAQANRLGSLGQITAGVAHEINQPLAAIRTFAESGVTLLDRAAPDRTRDNLRRIIELTERIGTITGELRGFARRRTPTLGAPTLAAAIEGTLLLIGDRARGVVEDRVPAAIRDTAVSGDRIRLEQILVNLIQNALDAVTGITEPRVTIAAERVGAAVTVRIADNGPGVDASLDDTLFTPFASAKPEGLGLGLAIARDIAREFGGELEQLPSPQGATFLLTLLVA